MKKAHWKSDSVARAHKEWIGLLQPTGLVVSPPALEKVGVVLNTNVKELQDALGRLLAAGGVVDERPRALSFVELVQAVLEWEESDLVRYDDDNEEHRRELSHPLEDFHETLRPTYAVPGAKGDRKWLALVKELPSGQGFDDARAYDQRAWQASAQARFERMLWETQIPIGLLFNGCDVRLCYVPRGESAGHVTFPLDAMSEVAGRSILGAFRMLLGAERLFTLPTKQRLLALLEESRKYQSVVSTELAEQVLAALHELVAGFQAANEHSSGVLLSEVLEEAPQEVYGGLLSTILRLVFVLYAEDRNLMPDDPLYQEGYSVSRLYERLREDAGLYPDTMDQRFGAWGQLTGLFRLVFDGAAYRDPDSGGLVRLPPRQGRLFNPDTYPFLEGRPWGTLRSDGERYTPPRVPDGVVFRVLENLMVLDGQRLSYRTLDVEQIGSVYEALMGFALERAAGQSIAVKPDHVVVDLAALLEVKGAARGKWLADRAGLKVPSGVLEKAGTVGGLLAALDRFVSRRGPGLIPAGAMYLQPTEERRRSGSHYTPRSLTEPIVRTALRPVLERLGERPTPSSILELKVCDPAMGSGAFLVEAVRQLSALLVKAWVAHPAEAPMDLPADETQEVRAARLVAQRCVYGVDKNPFAVELAKLSLWLATFAKDHPFTFVDHSLRHGDSLVGLSRKGILHFDWAERPTSALVTNWIEEPLELARLNRREIHEQGDTVDNTRKRALLKEANEELEKVRVIGDAVVAAFFAADKAKARDEERERLRALVEDWLLSRRDNAELLAVVGALRTGDRPIVPFHWEVEFPEVFSRKDGGFDVFVGNPPFAGKNTTINANAAGYLDWLKELHEESHGNADLVAHFFRRVFSLLRERGTFGLIATNTIAQGDTRSTGLRWICTHGGTIYAATRRYKWPGLAAVVVSVVHGCRGEPGVPRVLDGREVERITAFLFHRGGHESPAALGANAGKSFVGSYVLGMGFTFDDTDTSGVASSLAEMRRLVEANPRNAERIFPYIGGEELNSSPTQSHHRYVINFGEMEEEEARRGWPDLMRIVEQRVRGTRGSHSTAPWWQHERPRQELALAAVGLKRVLAIARVGQHAAIAFLPPGMVYSEQIIVFPFDEEAAFVILQSRPHELWARFFSSSLEDRLRYTPSDCFETFPFPKDWEHSQVLEDIGKRYYEYRADLMARNDEGLTKTYNRFHDPNERSPEILKLRELHAEMDRAVLDAYGWSDIQPPCEFLLDYEEEEDDEGKSKRKKPWRYRWLDDVRDEVLARLLELNQRQGESEALLGEHVVLATGSANLPPKRSGRKAGASKRGRRTADLFD